MRGERFLSEAPDACGVYIMRDEQGRVIYVGKAVNIKNRISQHFQSQDSKTRVLVKNTHSIDYVLTDNEIEALLLEAALIKEHQPRYNLRLKDDKAYPYIRISGGDYPSIGFARRRSRDGRYFGPYTSARSVRRIIRLAGEIFGIRTCHRKITGTGVPCLNFHIKRCSAPCAGHITREEYGELVEDVCRFLSGRHRELLKRLEGKMRECAGLQEFERAAQIRDQIAAIRAIAERQVVAAAKSADVIAVASGEDYSIVEVLHVREGRVVDKREHVMRGAGESAGEVIAAFIQQHYQSHLPPEEIITACEVEDKDLLARWLSLRRRVTITTPSRGRKKRLVDLAERNAALSLEHRRPSGLVELQEVLGLVVLPRHIEAFDVSHLAGVDATAGMVVFRDGMPDRRSYRRFRIKTVAGVDDYAMMEEVVSRRYRRAVTEGLCVPDLVLVDGGVGQVRAAHRAIAELGLDIPVVGLAKEFEHIYRLRGEPLVLPRSSEALKLLQRIRDEAHRFARSYHRRLHGKQSIASSLEIPGVGEVRRRRLLEHFGSVENLRRASQEEIAGVPGIGERLAAVIVEWLRKR
jgi:excinuclease ABC subunit C